LYEYKGVWTKYYVNSDDYSVPWFVNDSVNQTVKLKNQIWAVNKAELEGFDLSES
jgi:hypothetical protein